MAKNTIISEKQVADMRVFTVSEVELDKSGRRVHHSIIRFCGTASILAITKEGKILLEKQYRTPIDRWIYEIPAGKIDKGEDPTHCIIRELEEETGFKTGKMTVLGVCSPNPAIFSNSITVCLAEDLTPTNELHLDDDEVLMYETVPIDEVIDSFCKGEYVNAFMGTALALYMRHVQSEKQ